MRSGLALKSTSWWIEAAALDRDARSPIVSPHALSAGSRGGGRPSRALSNETRGGGETHRCRGYALVGSPSFGSAGRGTTECRVASPGRRAGRAAAPLQPKPLDRTAGPLL